MNVVELIRNAVQAVAQHTRRPPSKMYLGYDYFSLLRKQAPQMIVLDVTSEETKILVGGLETELVDGSDLRFDS